MENITVKDVILDKKLDEYGCNKNNFVAGSELTVEITLNEYRELVSSNATKNSDINKANEDKYKRDSENESLRKQIEELKAENYELKKKLEFIIGKNEEDNE